MARLQSTQLVTTIKENYRYRFMVLEIHDSIAISINIKILVTKNFPSCIHYENWNWSKTWLGNVYDVIKLFYGKSFALEHINLQFQAQYESEIKILWCG